MFAWNSLSFFISVVHVGICSPGMLQDREHMEEINLRENLSLTDAGIVSGPDFGSFLASLPCD